MKKEFLHFFNEVMPTKWCELLREGKWESKDLVVNKRILDLLKENFEQKVLRKDIAVDTTHTSEEGAVGWIKKLAVIQIKDVPQFLEQQNEAKETIQEALRMNEINKLDESKWTLWALIEWTPKGEKLLKDKIYKYLSAEIYPRVKDEEKNKSFNWVLDGAVLTNKPVIKGQPSIVLSELIEEKKGGEERMGILEALDVLKQYLENLGNADAEELSQVKAKLSEMSKKLQELISPEETEEERKKKEKREKEEETEELNEVEKAKKELSEVREELNKEIVRLREELEKEKKELIEKKFEIEFKTLLTEGVPPKSKDILKKLFLTDKEGYQTMVETLKGVVKLGEIGTSDDLPKGLTAKQQEINRKVGISDEVFLKYNPN